MKNITAYVDGSYDREYQCWGYGIVLLPKEDREAHYELTGNGTKFKQHWQIAGELYGAAIATNWCIRNGYKHLNLYYDYEGVEKWATCKWKLRKPLAIQYSMIMRDYMTMIDITFHKVKAHTGDRFNEMADRLAKSACQHYRMKVNIENKGEAN